MSYKLTVSKRFRLKKKKKKRGMYMRRRYFWHILEVKHLREGLLPHYYGTKVELERGGSETVGAVRPAERTRPPAQGASRPVGSEIDPHPV